MYISGSYALNAIENFDPAIEIDVFPLPGYTADRRVMLTSVDTALCISAQTPLKEETLQFLSYMTQPEIRDAVCGARRRAFRASSGRFRRTRSPSRCRSTSRRLNTPSGLRADIRSRAHGL